MAIYNTILGIVLILFFLNINWQWSHYKQYPVKIRSSYDFNVIKNTDKQKTFTGGKDRLSFKIKTG